MRRYVFLHELAGSNHHAATRRFWKVGKVFSHLFVHAHFILQKFDPNDTSASVTAANDIKSARLAFAVLDPQILVRLAKAKLQSRTTLRR
jgi:hypothetical protein